MDRRIAATTITPTVAPLLRPAPFSLLLDGVGAEKRGASPTVEAIKMNVESTQHNTHNQSTLRIYLPVEIEVDFASKKPGALKHMA
jgi:hypothetical protein